MIILNEKDKKRFLEKFPKLETNQCWERNNTSRPKFWLNGRMELAYRISYILFKNNNIPISDSILVCHKCDNEKCYNPKHLFLGNHSDNIQDSIKKGRYIPSYGMLGKYHSEQTKQLMSKNSPRLGGHGMRGKGYLVSGKNNYNFGKNHSGDNAPASKLTWEKVSKIRNSNLSGKELSKIFGITTSNISAIKHFKTWKLVNNKPGE